MEWWSATSPYWRNWVKVAYISFLDVFGQHKSFSVSHGTTCPEPTLAMAPTASPARACWNLDLANISIVAKFQKPGKIWKLEVYENPSVIEIHWICDGVFLPMIFQDAPLSWDCRNLSYARIFYGKMMIRIWGCFPPNLVVKILSASWWFDSRRLKTKGS